MRPLLAPLALAFVLVLGTGCGPQAKKDRAIKQADTYFAAGEYDKAEIEYRNAQRVEPLNAHAIGRLGLIYFEQGRQLRAFSFLSKGVELKPDNLDLKIKLAALQLSIRKVSEARDSAWAVLARRPADGEAPILIAESATQPKEMAEVRERLLALPAPASDGAPVLVALGILEFRQRKLDEAEALFQKALKRDPKSADAHAGMGIVALGRKDAAKAEAAFKAASEAAPARSPKRLQYAQFKLQSGDAAAGRQLLEEITKASPDYLPALLALAQLSATEKKPDEALGYTAKILARESAHPEALLLSGRMRLSKGETDKAIAEMERTASMFAQLPQAHYELAQAYLAKGDVGKATASINQAVTLAPRFTEAVVAQAGINIRKGDLGPAVASLQKVVQQRPDILEARSLLADALRQQGKLDDAIAVYVETEKVFPRLPTVPFFRGLILVGQKKYEDARKAFTRAVELAPAYTAAVEQLVLLDMREKKPDDARARVEILVSKIPKLAEGYVLLARVMAAQKDTKMTEMALQKAIAVQPESPAAFFLLARMQIENKEADKALANLQALVAKNPKNAEALRLMSAIYQEQKNYAAARDAYEKLIAANPNFGRETDKVVGSIYNNLAYLYSEQFNQIDKAHEMAQKARELLPLDPNVADTLGWILYKKKQFGQALALLQDSAEKLTNVAEVHFHLGMAHYMQGEEGAARAALQKALELSPDFVGHQEARTRLVVLGADAAALGVDPKSALEKTVAERKDDPVALGRLAAIYEREGALDKAASAYEAALAANPKNVNAMLGMVRILSSRNEDLKALELAKSARRVAPEDPDVAHLLGRVASQSGQHSWGYSLLQEAVRRKEDSPEILVDAAEAAFRLGKVADSETAMKRALEINPGFPRAGAARRFLEMLAIAAAPSDPAAMGKVDAVLKSSPNDAPALMAAGAVQELKRDAASARKSYEKVLSLYPEHIVAKKRFAILAATAKDADMKKALEYATKARETYPDDADVAKALGIIMYRQGTLPRAATLLQESSRKRESDAEVFFYLGMTKQKQQSKADAKAALQRALELKLGGEDAAEARKVLAELK